MTEQDALDQAAKAAGYDDWREVGVMNDRGGTVGRSIQAHANEILARHKAEQALADYKAEVSEAAAIWKQVQEFYRKTPPCAEDLEVFPVKKIFMGVEVPDFDRFIIPTPDPLAEVIKEAARFGSTTAEERADEQRRAAERLGYTIKLERIDQ